MSINRDEGVDSVSYDESDKDNPVRKGLYVENFLNPFLSKQESCTSLTFIITTPEEFIQGVLPLNEPSLIC